MKPTFWQRVDHIVGPATREEFGEIGQQRTRSAVESFVLAASDPETRVLDAGCNTGVEGHRLFEKGYCGSYIGVDSNLKALSFALGNLEGHAASFILADLEAVPFPDRHFDIVLSKDVIEHLSDYRPILRELCRLASRFLVLSMFIKMHDRPDVIQRTSAGYCLNRYNRRGLCDVADSCGFSSPRVLFEEVEDEVLVFDRR